MSKFYYQLKGKLDENKEDWYYLCNDAEQALFKVKEQCKDESAIKSLERMIIDLNSIRMEQYERLTEYSLVEEVVAATNLDLDDMPNELRKHFKNVNNKDYIKKSLKMHLDKGLINKDEYNTLSKEYKLNEEFWNEAGEKEYKGIMISIEKGDHGNTCYIPLRNKELNFIPEDRTQFFSWKEVKEYIDSKLSNKNLKESFEGNFEGKKIRTDLHNDKSNPVWIVGDISIDNKTYRVNAKVFLEDSEFGIENGPVSKLWIADSNGDWIINYDRGWDVKPTAETEEIYNIALGAVRSFRNDNPYEPNPEPEENINEAFEFISKKGLKESVEDEEDWSDPNYKVDTSNLYLTNYGYHNNSDIIYGRIHLLPKDKNSKLMPGHYDVIYYCENGEFQLFELGTDVRTAVDYLYNYGSDEYDWVKWRGRRIQLDNIYEILTEEALKNVPQEQRDAIEKAINNAYYNEEPFPLNKVKYD